MSELVWQVYILQCGDGSLYTGITNDLGARLIQHQKGKGAKYTRSHLPVKLAYQEICADRSVALIREAEIKKLPRATKIRLLVI